MSKLTPAPGERHGGPAPFQAAADGSAPDPEPDFADEHDSTNFTDELHGGPESVREPESPHGLAGED
jgi:hypothetical protein